MNGLIKKMSSIYLYRVEHNTPNGTKAKEPPLTNGLIKKMSSIYLYRVEHNIPNGTKAKVGRIELFLVFISNTLKF